MIDRLFRRCSALAAIVSLPVAAAHLITTELLSIRDLRQEDLVVAVDLTARGMRDNPLDIAAFGSDPVRRAERMRRLFRIALPMTHRKGCVFGAFYGATLRVCQIIKFTIRLSNVNVRHVSSVAVCSSNRDGKNGRGGEAPSFRW